MTYAKSFEMALSTDRFFVIFAVRYRGIYKSVHGFLRQSEIGVEAESVFYRVKIPGRPPEIAQRSRDSGELVQCQLLSRPI